MEYIGENVKNNNELKIKLSILKSSKKINEQFGLQVSIGRKPLEI